jgi:MOSC domain-containing protein YiiM
MSQPSIVSIHVGRAAPLGPDAVPSGFVKRAVHAPVAVGPLGLAGDEQADLSVHGGPEKAVYAYAAQHYDAWAAEFPQHADIWGPGAVGENLPIDGLTEGDLCVGDVHAVGGALLQVCQPRQPCFKFALRFGDSHLPKAMVKTGRSGWYYRVLQPGAIAAGDAVELRERPNPDFPFTRLVALISRGQATRAELEHLAEMPGLASQWRDWAQEALQGGR